MTRQHDEPTVADRLAADLEDQATVLRRDGTDPRIPRTMLEDRYHGLVDEPDDTWTELGQKLHDAIEQLIVYTARRDIDRLVEDGDPGGHTIGAAMAAVRETIIGEIDRRGIAR